MIEKLAGISPKFCAILGSQWGDEGKGKLVDILGGYFNVCARFNGGANAGHTIVVDGKKYALHQVPCGIIYPETINVLGNGVVCHIPSLFDELKQFKHLNYESRMIISNRATIVTQLQIEQDSKSETDSKNRFLGTTKKGIGPSYSNKALRIALRVGDLIDWKSFVDRYDSLYRQMTQAYSVKVNKAEELEQFKFYREKLIKNNMIQDTVTMLNQYMNDPKKKILAEGANAVMLDLDFGTYPYVTSSATWAGGMCTGLGLAPSKAAEAIRIGIVKAYTTRVGAGPFPTEQLNEVGTTLQKKGFEFGATTGRPRRCGWIDIPQLKYSHMLNDYSSINITKLDILSHFDEVQLGVGYEIDGKQIDYMPSTISELSKVKVVYETMKGWKSNIEGITEFSKLPEEAKLYIRRIEALLGVPVSWIGTGPKREDIILKKLFQ